MSGTSEIMMTDWYTFALLAFLLLGTQRFLYKVSAEYGCDSTVTAFFFMSTVAVLSTALCIIRREIIDNGTVLIILSLINGTAFAVSAVSTMEALKRIPAGTAYPIIRLNTLVVVVFSLIYFGERPTGLQIAGMGTALVAIIYIARFTDADGPSVQRRGSGLAFAVLSLLAGAAAALSSKFAAMQTNILVFIAASYAVSTVFSLVLRRPFRKARHTASLGATVIIGLSMGLLNFAGFFAFMTALSTGPLSIIICITGVYFTVAIALSALIYRERLTRSRLTGIVLAALSVILMRLP